MSGTDNQLSRVLLVFLTTLYEQRHLGRTATRLSISLPKASRLLAEARIVFEDPLYTRFGHGLAPTARAHEVTAQARRVLEEMAKLFAAETFDPAAMNRVIRISALDNAIPIMIEPVLELFMKKAPKAGIAILPHDEHTLLKLRAGEADLAIFPAVNLPADFVSVPLLRTPYVYAVRAGHPLEGKVQNGTLSMQDLEACRRIQICVHPDTDDPIEGVPGPAEIPLKAGRTMLWTEYWLGAVRLMHRTDAVLILPWRTAKALSEERPLTVLARAESVPWLEPSLIWHAHTTLDTGLEWVRSLFISALRGSLRPLEPDEVRLGRLGDDSALHWS